VSIQLRPGLPADADRLTAIIAPHRALLTLNPEGHGAEHFLASVSAQAIRGYLASARYRYTLAQRDSEVIGFIALREPKHLFHFFVAGSDQRQGVGRLLWESALRHLTSSPGASTVTVNASLNAVPIYQHLGFTRSGPRVEANGVAYVPMAYMLPGLADAGVSSNR